MFAPVSIVVPGPIWLTEPVPEIAAVVVSESARSNTSAPSSAMAEVPLIVLLKPPLPSCSVPGGDRRCAGVGVVAGENRGAGSDLA